MTERVIEVRGLTRTYRMGDVLVNALRGVDLDVARGEFLAVMGASGSGKSTLMNVLGCLDRPSSGSYLLEGTDVARLDETSLARVRSLRIGFVFQSFQLLPRTSALENVMLPLFYSGRMADAPARATQALRSLGLAGREASQPSESPNSTSITQPAASTTVQSSATGATLPRQMWATTVATPAPVPSSSESSSDRVRRRV